MAKQVFVLPDGSPIEVGGTSGNATLEPTPNTIPLRGTAGDVKAGNPLLAADVVTLGLVGGMENGTLSAVTAAKLLPSVEALENQFITSSTANRRGFVLKGGTFVKLVDATNQHYIFGSDTDIEITSAEALLDSGSVFTNGRDYYIYLCLMPEVSGQARQATLRVSLNSTYPSGYDAYSSRKIGGFHTICANAGTLPSFVWGGITYAHPLSGYLSGDILPQSFWDLKHRPTCSPEGMVNLSLLDDIWVDIYLSSGTGTNTASQYQGTITRSRQYHRMLEEDVAAVGKTGLSSTEFAAAARGSNEETAVNGATVDAATTGGAGGRLDTAGRRMLSADGCEEMCGSLWQVLEEYGAGGGAGSIYGMTNTDSSAPTYGWLTLTTSAHGPFEQDSDRGSFWGLCGVLCAGGYWAYSVNCGSASRGGSHSRSHASTSVGVRGRARSRVSR